MSSQAAQQPQTSASLVARLWREHIRRHLGPIVFAALCMVVAAAATAANAWLLQPVMDEIFLAGNRELLLLVPLAVLGLALVEETPENGQIGPLLDLLVELRTELRNEKLWALADRIRDELAAQGITLEDGPQGTTWR